MVVVNAAETKSSIVEIPIANVDRSRLRLDKIQKDFRIHIDMENY